MIPFHPFLQRPHPASVAPEPPPPHPRAAGRFSRDPVGGKGGNHPAEISPEPRGRSEQVTAGRGLGPRLRPYLFHVGRQLAPRVVVPNVELHVYVHDAGSPGRRLRPRPLQERRLPPARPRPIGGARGRPRASHGARPGLPHGQGFRRLGAARATGHRSSGERWQRCLGSSKFLPSFGPPEMALDLRHFRPLERGWGAGRQAGLPGPLH